jgi:glycosyltransferase involved in cell wall biosynthesis
MKNELALIFRSQKKNRFSIEKVYKPIESFEFVKSIKLKDDLNSILSFFKIIFFCLNIKQKIIHVTGDVHFVIFILFWKKSILTIHDLNHYESMKSGIRKSFYSLFWFYLPLKFANKVVTISPFTKIQLQNNFKVLDSKIIVIPNSFIHPEKSITRRKTYHKYIILFIGSTENKNLKRLIEAIDTPELVNIVELEIVGKQTLEIINKLNNCKISYTISCNLTEEELNNKYLTSNVLFFASTKEGFGLPILEAQSRGLNVITSTTTSMPFVAGNGAIFVNPYKVKEIRAAILDLIYDKVNKEELVENGYANINRFSEKDFINSYFKLYNSFFVHL